MGDMGDIFNSMKKKSKDKRASNREYSAKLLRDNNISFTEHNDGAHLIVVNGSRTVDFWPGTGKWRDRAGREARGVNQLVAYLNLKKVK